MSDPILNTVVSADVKLIAQYFVNSGICSDMPDICLNGICAMNKKDTVSKMAAVQQASRRVLRAMGVTVTDPTPK